MSPCLLDVIKFQKRCDPIKDNCWGLSNQITENDVKKAVDINDLLHPKPNKKGRSNHLSLTSDQKVVIFHITRVAWFVVYGWNDPINIDVGVPSLGCFPKWPLEDGNHRFAAAIIRGNKTILANMSGAVSDIKNFLWKT